MQIYLLVVVLLSLFSAYLLRSRYLASRQLIVLKAGLVEKPAATHAVCQSLGFSSADFPGYFYTDVHHQDGRMFTYFSGSGMRDLFGLEVVDAAECNRVIANLIHADDSVVRQAIIEASGKNSSALHMECRFHHPELGLRWLETRSLPMSMPDGSLCWRGFMHDITERKLQEERLISREREFRTLAENSPDLLARYDRDCRIVYANPRLCRALGRSLEYLLGKTPLQIAGFTDADFFVQRIAGVVETGNADAFEHSSSQQAGLIDWQHVKIVPEFDEAGRLVYVQMSSRDIGELKEVESYLENSRVRLRSLLAHMEDNREQERMRLSFGIHEDLLQILVVMNMYARSLRTDLSSVQPTHARMLGNLEDGLGCAVKLVREMAAELHPAVLSLGIELALEWLVSEFLARNKAMSCALEIDVGVVRMEEKAALLYFRIVQEILLLASKFSSVGHLCITLDGRGHYFLLKISDPDGSYDIDISNVRFFNLLGLQERVLEMGGEMVVFGAPDQGLIVEVKTPIECEQLSFAI